MKIYSPNLDITAIEQMVHMSCGVTHEYNNKFISYYPPENWTQKNDGIICTDIHKAGEKFISVLQIDPYIRELFWNKIVPLIFDTTPDIKANVLKSFNEEVIRRLENQEFCKLKRLYAHELVFNPPHKISTAFNHAEQRQIGLHIDTHNIKSLWQRRRGFELLSINLGEAERYFYFINLEVNEIIKKLKEVGHNTENYSTVGEIKNDFLKHFPNYPIYRLTIQPDQAYIGISQNFIHDGGTNDIGKPDVTLLMAGYFKWL